jgi:hypothetical protein
VNGREFSFLRNGQARRWTFSHTLFTPHEEEVPMFSISGKLCFQTAWLASCAALVASLASLTALAQPPVASTDVKAADKVGVTLYQVNGLKGSIPLKKVYKVDPSGDTGHYELQFASSNMNTEMEIMAKYVVPAGMTFQSFEVRTVNGPTQVTPAGADSWDGKTIIDKVTVSPWNMNHVLQQCVAHLQNGNDTFEDSATFDLEADSTETIRGNASAFFPNAPPGSASSATGTMKPRTRVTAYIVGADRKGSDDREVKRVAPAKSTTQPADVIKTPVAKTPVVTPQPQRTAPARLTGTVNPVLAKDRFERTKPHVNVSPSRVDPQRFAPPRTAEPKVKPRVPQR